MNKPKNIDEKVDFLVEQTLKQGERLSKVEDRLDNMPTKGDLHSVMVSVQTVLKEVLSVRTEQAAHTSDHQRVNERLKKLEAKRAVS
jgi:hypothetical protein